MLKGKPQLCPHGILRNMYCPDCEEKDEPVALPEIEPIHAEVTCWVRVFFKYGAGWVDIPMQGPFQLGPWTALVKGSGGVMTASVHIPVENILCYAVLDSPHTATLAGAGLEKLHIAGKPN